jgi:hypothetical protein
MQQATIIFSRLTEVEKLKLRAASPGAIDYLANTAYLSDMPDQSFEERAAVLTEVRALALLAFATASARTDYGPGLAF